MTKKTDNPHVGHRERLYKKISREKFTFSSETDLLEAFLFATVPLRDTRGTAKSLLAKYGTLKNVCCADSDELAEEKGITNKAIVLLNAVPMLSKVFLDSKSKIQYPIYDIRDLLPYAQTIHSINPNLLISVYVTSSNGVVYREAIKGVNMSPDHADRIILKARQLYTRRVMCFYFGDEPPSAEENETEKDFRKYLAERGILLVEMVKICGNDMFRLTSMKYGKVLFKD